MDISLLLEKRKECVRTLLQLYHMAHAGHIGASLSCMEILVELLFCRMNPEDCLILSKGHAAAALYSVLAESGRMDKEMLRTFYKDGTYLSAHPPCGGGGRMIPFGTGSLGHGLSLASGIALSQRYTKKNFQVYCVLSDGDCNEGSTWEAVMFAAQNQLSNLTVIVDANRLQGFGRAEEVCNLEPLPEKWRDFGFDTVIAENGNDFESLHNAYGGLLKSDCPRCVVARTTKGHGVSFMENRMEWHYLPMTSEQYLEAIGETEVYRA